MVSPSDTLMTLPSSVSACTCNTRHSTIMAAVLNVIRMEDLFCACDTGGCPVSTRSRLSMPPRRENGTCPILQLPAFSDQLTRCPNLLVDHLGQLPQLRPVAAPPGIARNPFLAFRRGRPGGLLPRLPGSNQCGLTRSPLRCPAICHDRPPIVGSAQLRHLVCP